MLIKFIFNDSIAIFTLSPCGRGQGEGYLLKRLLAFFLSCLLLLDSIPASAIRDIGSPSSGDQAALIPSSIFDGSGNRGTPHPTPLPQGERESKRMSRGSFGGISTSGPFGDSYGTDPMLGKPSRVSPPRAPGNEQPADPDPSQKSSSSPDNTNADSYNSSGQPVRGGSGPGTAGLLALGTAIATVTGIATGASWASILISVALGSVGFVLAVALLSSSAVSGALSGTIDSFSFGSNPAKDSATDKDNREDPLNPFFEATYLLAKTALLLGSVAFTPLALTGVITVSLPVLIAGTSLSALNLLSTAVSFFGSKSSNTSVIASEAKQSHKEIPPPHFSPEQLQSLRAKAIDGKQESHIAFEYLNPDITPEIKARKYPDDTRAYNRIKESNQKSKWSFTIATKPEDPSPLTTRGYLAYGDHDGLDISAPKDAPVINQEEAVVLYAR